MSDATLPGSMSGPEIENLMAEGRKFAPSAEFTAQANATHALYDEAERDYVAFWRASRSAGSSRSRRRSSGIRRSRNGSPAAS
jgi:hypothetical protein